MQHVGGDLGPPGVARGAHQLALGLLELPGALPDPLFQSAVQKRVLQRDRELPRDQGGRVQKGAGEGAAAQPVLQDEHRQGGALVQDGERQQCAAGAPRQVAVVAEAVVAAGVLHQERLAGAQRVAEHRDREKPPGRRLADRDRLGLLAPPGRQEVPLLRLVLAHHQAHPGGAGHGLQKLHHQGPEPLQAGLRAQGLGGAQDGQHVDGVGGDAGRPAAVALGGARSPQEGVPELELAHLGAGPPGGVELAGPDHEAAPQVSQAVFQVEQGGPLGDQGALPGALQPRRLIQGGVELFQGGAELPQRPGALGIGPLREVQKVVGGVGGAPGQEVAGLVQLGQNFVPLLAPGPPGLPGQGEHPHELGRHRFVKRAQVRQVGSQGGAVPDQLVPVVAQGPLQRPAQMEDGRGAGVVTLGGDAGPLLLPGAAEALLAVALPRQLPDQFPVVGERRLHMGVAGARGEVQGAVHPGGEALQGGGALQGLADAGVVGEAGVLQIAPLQQPFVRPVGLLHAEANGVEPGGDAERVQAAGLGGVRLPAARLAERQDVPHGAVPGAVIAAQRDGDETEVA